MNDTSVYRWGNSPALQFEQATGLTGLHTPWVMPDGQSYEQVETHAQALWEIVMPDVRGKEMPAVLEIFATRHKDIGTQLIAQFDAVVACNPALEILNFARANPLDALGITCGTASQFNLQDLVYAATCTVEENRAAIARNERVEKRSGVFPRWILSPATFAHIEAQLDARDAALKVKPSPATKPGMP